MWLLFVFYIYATKSPTFAQGDCCQSSGSQIKNAVEPITQALDAAAAQPMLHLELDARKFRGATGKETKMNVSKFMQTLGVAIGSYQDNDILRALILEKPNFSHQKGWLTKSKDDLHVQEIEALPFVERVSFADRPGGVGRYIIVFKESNLPYESQTAPIYKILPGFKNTQRLNPAMVGTIWVDSTRSLGGEQIPVEKLKEIAKKLKATPSVGVLKAEVVRKEVVMKLESK